MNDLTPDRMQRLYAAASRRDAAMRRWINMCRWEVSLWYFKGAVVLLGVTVLFVAMGYGGWRLLKAWLEL